MILRDDILGVILAGGSATRMFPVEGAGDKGLAELGGRPMLAHVIARLRPQVGRLVLNANGEAGRFDRFGLDVIADDADCTARGPLAGLLTAMRWVAEAEPTFRAVVTVSTDAPFLPLNLVARLAGVADGRPVLAASAGHRHPAIGLWPLSLMDAVAVAAHSDDWSIGRLADKNGGLAVDFPIGESGVARIDPFFNANTPEDLEAARALIAATG